MATWIAAAIAIAAIAAIAATYFFCIRPGMHARCATSGNNRPNAAVDRQLAELREDLRVLRAQDSLYEGQGPVPSRLPTPPADA